MRPATPTDLGQELVLFFEEFLPGQRGLSPNTVRSYRDALVLWLQFTAADAKRAVERLQIRDLTAERVIAFLNHLEAERGNGIARRMPGSAPSTSSPASWPGDGPRSWAHCSR
jgi:site-specific recombinase XerD